MGSKPISRSHHVSVPPGDFLPATAIADKTPVFMRVRRTAPSSTFNFPASFVNDKPPEFFEILRVFVDFSRSLRFSRF